MFIILSHSILMALICEPQLKTLQTYGLKTQERNLCKLAVIKTKKLTV
jgi:hypothetical protein